MAERPSKVMRRWPRLFRNKAGNIAITTAMMMIPLTFALGMAFDFTLSQSRKDQLDGIADVAALGAVTPAEMSQLSSVAQTQATNMFNGQETSVTGISGLTLTVVVNDTTSGSVVTRTSTVSYVAQSKNVFGNLLGMSTIPVQGSSTAQSTTAANIDFYLLLDTSPSMEIAATSSGMAAMEAGTQLNESDIGTPPNGNGCAFGCHQSNPSDLTAASGCISHTDPATGLASNACQFLTYNSSNSKWQKIACTTSGQYADGTSFTSASTFPESGRDNYDLSRCLGVTLRIDLLNTATQNLMTNAASMEATYHSTYRMALYETDFNQSNPANDLNLYSLQSLTSSLSTAQTAASGITALEMYQNNHLASGDSNGDMDTFLDSDITSLNGLMPAPGNGTNNSGDTPQEVMFIVTDGLNDDTPTRTYAPLDWNGTICSAVKARGIRIAVLYTTYEPINESWYLTVVTPALAAYSGLPPDLPTSTPVGTDPMALAAQQCASAGLYTQVSTDGDISAAMQGLFQKAIKTAHLTQ